MMPTAKVVKLGEDASKKFLGVVLPRSCADCFHLPVCVAFRQISKFLATEFSEKVIPFNDVDLAKICHNYMSAAAVAILGKEDD